VMELDWIVIGGGSRSCKVVGVPQLLTALPNVEVIEDLAKPMPAEVPPDGAGMPTWTCLPRLTLPLGSSLSSKEP
jgi:hypothetical protein